MHMAMIMLAMINHVDGGETGIKVDHVFSVDHVDQHGGMV